jgi:hypothetical protein
MEDEASTNLDTKIWTDVSHVEVPYHGTSVPI